MTSNSDLHVAEISGGEQQEPATFTTAEKPNVTATGNGNVNVEALLGEESKVIDFELQRRVLRKIDCFLMPAMVIGIPSTPYPRPFFLRRMNGLIIMYSGYGLVYWDKVR
jgi:hypothetical protein